RHLHLVFLFKSNLNGSIDEFMSSHGFVLPQATVPQQVVNPRSFFEAPGPALKNITGALKEDLRVSFADAFAEQATGTISFWTGETVEGGKPNHIKWTNEKRTFVYDPVRRIVQFSCKPVPETLTLSFEPGARHYVAISWDASGPKLLFVDGKKATK